MENLITKEKKDQIDLLCKDYGIKNYSINPDGTIDVDGDVKLQNIGLVKIPIKFNKVSGFFRCDDNSLSTLEGAPTTVGGNFDCEGNLLRSLEGAPTTVGGYFAASYNNLTSTYAGEVDIEDIGGNVFLTGNSLLELFVISTFNMRKIKLILKYQRHFEIWNEDLTLNEENFQVLIDEINDGLL